MKVVLTGARGQLGRALQASVPADVELVAHGGDTLDITDAQRIAAVLTAERPDWVINAAAYTAVDRAESEPGAAEVVNAAGPGLLARAVAEAGARLAHLSTDFVFDGRASTPYAPGAATGPLGVYGRTKLAGEAAAGSKALIVRTAWVYAPTGANFVRTMLRLMAERPEVRVVADQIGTPTYAPGLACALWRMVGQGLAGIHHWTDSGVASWYDFAVAIQEEALAAGLLDRAVPVLPIATAEYPTPARRPAYSVLDKSATIAALGTHAPHWRVNLRTMIAALAG